MNILHENLPSISIFAKNHPPLCAKWKSMNDFAKITKKSFLHCPVHLLFAYTFIRKIFAENKYENFG